MATVYLVLGENKQNGICTKAKSREFFHTEMKGIIDSEVRQNGRRVSVLLEGDFFFEMWSAPALHRVQSIILATGEKIDNSELDKLSMGIEPAPGIRSKYDLGFFDLVLGVNNEMLCPVECQLEPQLLSATYKLMRAQAMKSEVRKFLESKEPNKEIKAYAAMKAYIKNLCEGLLEKDMVLIQTVKALLKDDDERVIILPRDRKNRYMKENFDPEIDLVVRENRDAELISRGSYIGVAIAASYIAGLATGTIDSLARSEVERLLGKRQNAASTISFS